VDPAPKLLRILCGHPRSASLSDGALGEMILRITAARTVCRAEFL
jgi:hypothetical protein